MSHLVLVLSVASVSLRAALCLPHTGCNSTGDSHRLLQFSSLWAGTGVVPCTFKKRRWDKLHNCSLSRVVLHVGFSMDLKAFSTLYDLVFDPLLSLPILPSSSSSQPNQRSNSLGMECGQETAPFPYMKLC